jgi:beta-lactam-binding protein with PASTA domain
VATRTCQNCGRENPIERDFCACGEYLRWEPTNYQMPAVTPPAPPVEQPAEQPPAAAPPPPPAPPATSPLEPQFRTRAQRAAPPPRQAAPPPPPAPSPPPPAPSPPPPAPSPPPPPPQSAAPPRAPDAAITLRLPQDQPRAGGDAVGLAVVPGERARVLALVRNQSDIVDNYELVVHGLPREWWTVKPETVYLVPFGSAGAYEQEIELLLHPPRTPEAEARRWDLQVGVYSRARDDEVAAASLTLGILPFEDFAIRVRPERASGRLQAKYDVRIANNANAIVLLAIDAADSDGECRFRFESRKIQVPTGATKTVRLRVRPPRQIWLGRALERRFEVVAASGEAGEQLLAAALEGAGDGDEGKDGKLPKIPGLTPPKVSAPKLSVGPQGVNVKGPQVRAPQVKLPKAKAINLSRPTLGLRALKPSEGGAAAATPPAPLLPKQAIFRQKGWLPWWLSVVVPLVALLGVMVFLLLPKHVTVPALVGAKSSFDAQSKLTAAGLVLGTKEPTPSKKANPGVVLAQTPAAGTDVEKKSAVNIEVAVSAGQETNVPKLAGLTFQEATKKLRDDGLTKGALSISPPDLKAKIATTDPPAGERVKVGTPVDIFFVDPKAAAGGAGGAGGKGGKGGDIAVPDLKPPDVRGYIGVLTNAGLAVGTTEKQISDAKAGTLFGTDPAVGTKLAKGAKVNLLVSAGFPLMAFDTSGNVVLVDAGTGKRVTPAIAKTPVVEKDAAWAPDGVHVVYTIDGQLFMSDPTKRTRPPIPLRKKDEQYADMSFAPTADKLVLSAARLNADGTESDLCIGKVTIDRYVPFCLQDDRFVARVSHWSPSGKTILVSAKTPTGNAIVRYHSPVPFSTKKSDWGKGVFVTPRSPAGGIIEEAVSPDGKRLAAIANLDGPAPLVYLSTPGDLKLEKATKLEVQACKLAWMDSRWLAAVKLGQDCGQDTGEIVRLSVDKPTEVTTITTDGDNPTFQPLTAGG